MTPDQKQCLAKLRQTIRTIAYSQGIESALWDFIIDIDSMMETGKSVTAKTPDELIDICVRELSTWIDQQGDA